MSKPFEPKVLAFLCNWCSYAGADLAGVSRFQYPPTIRVMRTMCSGRVDPTYIFEGLENGFDAVFVFGCHIGDCHYIDGNVHTAKRMQVVREMLEMSGIGKDRMHLRWVSAAEGQKFADFVSELSALIVQLGPFDAEANRLPLAAAKRAFESPRLRWLLGMDRQLTERENVYHEKIDPEKYEQLLGAAAREELEKALILETLREGSLSVRSIASKSGLPVYTVSQRLSDIEKAGQVELDRYEGTTPLFVSLAV